MQRTPLQFACGQGSEAVVGMLLSSGAQVNLAPPVKRLHSSNVLYVTPYNGRTALQAASENGHLHLVEKLLNLGADVNAPASPTRGRTALQAAAANGFARVAGCLLQHGADPAKFNGLIALQRAYMSDDVPSVNVLLAAGVDVQGRGGTHDYTPVHVAAEHGHLDILQILATAGADVNAVSKGVTPPQSAARHGQDAAVRLLETLGAVPPKRQSSFT